MIVVLKRIGANNVMQKCIWPQPYRPPVKLGLQAKYLPDLEEKRWRLSSASWQMIQSVVLDDGTSVQTSLET